MADELRHARGERTSFSPLYRDDHFPRRETQRAIKTFRDVRHSVANTTDFIFRKRSLDSSSDENVLETTRFLRWEKGWSPPLYIYIYIYKLAFIERNTSQCGIPSLKCLKGIVEKRGMHRLHSSLGYWYRKRSMRYAFLWSFKLDTWCRRVLRGDEWNGTENDDAWIFLIVRLIVIISFLWARTILRNFPWQETWISINNVQPRGNLGRNENRTPFLHYVLLHVSASGLI